MSSFVGDNFNVFLILMLSSHIKCFVQECEESPDAVDPDIAELLTKCKAGLIDYQVDSRYQLHLHLHLNLPSIIFSIVHCNPLLSYVKENTKSSSSSISYFRQMLIPSTLKSLPLT